MPGQAGQFRCCGQRRVHFVAACGRARRPASASAPRPGRRPAPSDRDRPISVTQVGRRRSSSPARRARSGRTCRPASRPGSWAWLDGHVRLVRRARSAAVAHRGGRPRPRRAAGRSARPGGAVSMPVEQPGSNADAVAGPGQRRHGQRVLAGVVPAGLEAPRVGAGGVHLLEVAERGAHCEDHLEGAAEAGQDVRRQDRGVGRAGPSGAIWLGNAAMAAALARLRGRRSGRCGGPGPRARARRPGCAQCQVQIGYSSSRCAGGGARASRRPGRPPRGPGARRRARSPGTSGPASAARSAAAVSAASSMPPSGCPRWRTAVSREAEPAQRLGGLGPPDRGQLGRGVDASSRDARPRRR